MTRRYTARDSRYWQSKRGKACARRYKQSKKGKATTLRWQRSKAGKDAARRKQLKGYGLTFESYRRLFRKQHGRCPVCGRKLPSKFSANVDHNHNTGRVRGLLHWKCNYVLGLLEDNPRFALAAAKYLLTEPNEK